MTAIEELLQNFLRTQMSQKISSAGDVGRVQPVLVASSQELLLSLWKCTTSDGTHDWSIQLEGDERRSVAVILIEDSPPSGLGQIISARATWDYAVAVRNSNKPCLILASARAWDSSQESIVQASEQLWLEGPQSERVPSVEFWGAWNRVAADAEHSNTAGTDPSLPMDLLEQIVSNLHSGLKGRDEDRLWEIADELLRARGRDELIARAGLVVFPATTKPAEVVRTVQRLAKACKDLGLEGARELLQGSANGDQNLTDAIDGLFDQLVERAGTGAAFQADWSAHLSNQLPAAWRTVLDYTCLRSLLLASGIEKPAGKLSISLVSPAVNPVATRKGPRLVRGAPRFSVVGADGQSQVHRIEQGKKLQISPNGSGEFHETEPLLAERTTRYQGSAGLLLTEIIHVVDVETFAAGVIAWGPQDEQVVLPKRTADGWVQRLSVTRPNHFSLEAFVPADCRAVRVRDWGNEVLDLEPLDGRIALPPSRIEESQELTLTIVRAGIEQTLRVVLDVEAIQPGTEPGILEALLRTHISGNAQAPIAAAAQSPIRDAERYYLGAVDSWRGRFGGWAHAPDAGFGLSAQAQFGTLTVPSERVATALEDARPPQSLLECREAVRQWLQSKAMPVPEIEVDTPDFRVLAEAYLTEFLVWFKEDPVHAAWFDALVVFSPEAGELGGPAKASHRPVALIHSPLHPMRVAANCGAQTLLRESIELPCPIAGDVSVFYQPSAAAVALGIDPVSGERNWLGFHRAASNQPWWHLMWSTGLPIATRAIVARQLCELGLHATLSAPGMDVSQVARALDDVAFLSPSRTALRVGLAGTSSAGGAAVSVLDWAGWRFAEQDRARVQFLNPKRIDILDLRRDASTPTGQRISDMADRTGGAIAWYRGRPNNAVADILLVEGLGEEKTDKALGAERSAISPGAFFRLDPPRQGADQILIEPRIVGASISGSGLSRRLEEGCMNFEAMAADRTGADHIERRPPSISDLLPTSRYLALGSGEIDPALLSAMIEDKALLWDYELPVPGEPLQSTAGYYLLARATNAQKRRISEALTLVVGKESINPEHVLREISARGIPLLRRFAAGGSSTRGELGLFLAVRLLQGRLDEPSGAMLPAFSEGQAQMLVSVDSYAAYLRLIRSSLSSLDHAVPERIPDLLLVTIQTGDTPRVRLTPIEVKYRGGSTELDQELAEHLSQATSLSKLLDKVFHVLPSLSQLWHEASRAWLAGILNHAFRVYSGAGLTTASPSEWTQLHGAALRDLLSGRSPIEIDPTGRLIVFDASAVSSARDVNSDYVRETIRVSQQDSARLVQHTPWSTDLATAVRQVFGEIPRFTSEGMERDAAAVAPEADPRVALHTRTPEGEPRLEQEVANVADTSESDQAESPLTEFDKARADVAQSFVGFVGNSNAVDRISRDLVVALTSTPRALARSFLFSGPPSSGKTEICRRIAKAIALPFVPLDGTALKSRERLFELVDKALDAAQSSPELGQTFSGLPLLVYPPFVVFVDEIHLVSKSVQESFLTALESKDRRVHLGNRYVELRHATFLFATTRPSSVDSALRSRCDTITLLPYSSDDVAVMVELAFPGWPTEIYRSIAMLGRRVPRIALRIAEDLKNELRIRQGGDINSHLETIRIERELDSHGFGPSEYQYLQILNGGAGRPLGLEAIAAHMRSIPVEAIESEIEPFLLQEHVIEFTGRGRQLTRKGIEWLARRQT